MQDEVLWVFKFTGLSEERILGLSFEQFRSLYSSCERLDAGEKRMNAWTMMVAAQATGKTMEKWTKKWEAAAQGIMETDGDKLAARFGKKG